MKHSEEFYQNIWQTVNDFIHETEYQSLEPDVDFQYCEDKGNDLFNLISEKYDCDSWGIDIDTYDTLQEKVEDVIINQMYMDKRNEFGPDSMSDDVVNVMKEILEN